MSKVLDTHFAAAFIEAAVEGAAKDADDILWAKCDPVINRKRDDIDVGSFTVTMRDNFDGPGTVRSFRVAVTWEDGK